MSTTGTIRCQSGLEFEGPIPTCLLHFGGKVEAAAHARTFQSPDCANWTILSALIVFFWGQPSVVCHFPCLGGRRCTSRNPIQMPLNDLRSSHNATCISVIVPSCLTNIWRESRKVRPLSAGVIPKDHVRHLIVVSRVPRGNARRNLSGKDEARETGS